MGPDGIGKLLKNFCESVNKARDAIVQLRKAQEREASQTEPGQIAPPRFLPTQQKARGTSVQFEFRAGSTALPLGLFSELSEKVCKVTPVKPEEAETETKESSTSLAAPQMPAQRIKVATNPPTQDTVGIKVNCTNETEAKVNMEIGMEGKKRIELIGVDQDIGMEASVEELDLLLADFTIKSRERRRRRLR